MIFKTKNSFQVYIIKIRPGKVASPYLGESSVAFDHQPKIQEVLEELEEQEKEYNKDIHKVGLKKGKGRDQFQELVIKTLKKIGVPKIKEYASTVNSYGDNKFKKEDTPLACVSISRIWVNCKGTKNG